jgi:hypothetical protein
MSNGGFKPIFYEEAGSFFSTCGPGTVYYFPHCGRTLLFSAHPEMANLPDIHVARKI